MKILVAHTNYLQRGGEDIIFDNMTSLLRNQGHEVILFNMNNSEMLSLSLASQARVTLWNSHVYKTLKDIIIETSPDIIHCQNIFPLISPSAYYAARSEGIPIIQHLHNYRLVCPNAYLFRKGSVCEDCIAKPFPWPGVIHACYRDSHLASATVASMLSLHRMMGTWKNKVDRYIVPSNFGKHKFIEGGFSLG